MTNQPSTARSQWITDALHLCTSSTDRLWTLTLDSMARRRASAHLHQQHTDTMGLFLMLGCRGLQA
ncbi:hypothetical protein EYF80_063767 [Liparis tanakae]|uniref:Uncharacterized protein n=1 Tax=Liparis tanakae TaxID=230148 RepID=A0A4Z2EB36_9TELE|nr:hypothetical protein EYF80_063767 [Liparis tanakae]